MLLNPNINPGIICHRVPTCCQGTVAFIVNLDVHIMSLTRKMGNRISWRNVKIGDLSVIIGTNYIVVLVSMAVEFVLTLLLLLNIPVSLMDLVVNTLEF